MSKQRLNTVRGILNEIDRFLARNDDESKKLWEVLVALRGPDSDVDSDKYATTAIVRKTAFPKAFSKPYDWNAEITRQNLVASNGAFGAKDNERAVERRKQLELKGYSHFTSHAKRAFYVLNLNWSEKN